MKLNNLIKRAFIAIAMILAVNISSYAYQTYNFEVDGIYYTILSSSNKTVCVTYKEYNGGYVSDYSGDVIIPETVEYNDVIYSVTLIRDNAFFGCSGLTSVTIGNSVTSIGEYAFESCSGLTSVTIGNSVTSIGYQAFMNCSGLTSVTIPNSVTSIGDWAFAGCSSLTSVHITDIESWCKIDFIGDDSNPLLFAKNLYLNGELLTNLVIPEGITEIKKYAFINCRSLTSVVIPNSVTSIGNYAFYDCRGLTGELVIPNSVTSIGDYVFCGCSGLTSVTIGNSVTLIRDNAFFGCSGLTSVVIPEGVTSIGNYAFYDCRGLTGELVIPNSVISIGSEAFSGCSGLTNVTIGNGVTSIGSQAFAGCSSLINVTIGNSVTIIDFGTFRDCSTLTSVVIPEGVTSIENNVFYGCSSLTSVVIPEGVTSIKYGAFNGCRGLTGKLELPSSITSIDEYAFTGTSYKMCKIDATVPPTINSNSLSSSLSLVIVPANSADAYKADEQWSKYTIVAEGACDIEVTNETAGELSRSILTQTRKNLNNITSLTVHGTLNAADIEKINSNMTSLLHLDISDTDVTEIPANSFKNKTTLLSVKLPNGLISIGDYAFSGTYLSEELVLPETLETIGKYAFNNCSLMSGTLKFPASIKQIGSYGFYGCSAITEVDLSEATELEILDTYVFANCNTLETVKLNNTLKNIGANTFYNCSKLGDVEIPSTIEAIGNYAFYGCSSIKMLDLSKCESLTSISNYAFSGCSSIETVNFPSTLTSIGTNSFANCTNLQHMSVPCTIPPTIANNAEPFSGVDNIACVLSIPTDNFFDYWDANYWGGFVDVENKSDIQIEVTDPEDEFKPSNPGFIHYPFGCLIHYHKHHGNKPKPRALSLNNFRLSLTEEVVEKVDDKNKAFTAGGQSVFVGNGDAVTFYFTPEDGKEIDKVLFNGEDVTEELVNNTYTTSAVSEMSSLQVILRQGTLTEIEETLVSEDGEVEYYNLQGVRVENPSGGIFIKKQGNKVTKVIL